MKDEIGSSENPVANMARPAGRIQRGPQLSATRSRGEPCSASRPSVDNRPRANLTGAVTELPSGRGRMLSFGREGPS